jgi:hypothetical protein
MSKDPEAASPKLRHSPVLQTAVMVMIPARWDGNLGFSFLQKQLYDFYGDKRIIEKNYAAFRQSRWVFLQSKAVDNLFYWDIGDHEALDTKADAFSAACFLLSSCETCRRVCRHTAQTG